jgi:predicted Zn-dependent peptidase
VTFSDGGVFAVWELRDMNPVITTQKTVMPNGIRVLSESAPYVDSVSVGIWVGAGSRWEDPSVYGISHFTEHMLFKGTERRTAKQIADEMDSLGAHLNAFTDKEYTCFYAKALKEHLDVAMDVLTDMTLNSLLEPVEIDREKNVVLEEIKRHEDTPDDLVHDVFAQNIWQRHPLGNPVIGTRKTVKSLTQERLRDYMAQEYAPDNMVISAAGNLEHEKLVGIVENLLGSWSGKRTAGDAIGVKPAKHVTYRRKRTEQVHFCVGVPGYAQSHNDKYTLAIIDSILGGGMSSRLFQEIREKRGLAYAIGSYSASYREAGMFVVYGGTSLGNFDETLGLVRKEFGDIVENSATDTEIERAKNQIRGSLVLGQESMSNRMSRMAKSEMYFGRIVPLAEIVSSVMGVSRDDVSRVAAEMFSDSELAMAAIGPFKASEVTK